MKCMFHISKYHLQKYSKTSNNTAKKEKKAQVSGEQDWEGTHSLPKILSKLLNAIIWASV